MSDYVPTNWEDEVPATTPVKYKISQASDGDIATDATIEVVTSITPGTPVNATNLNKIEQALEDAHADGFVTLAKMAANSVDATKIVNRTRTFFVPCISNTLTLNPSEGYTMPSDNYSTVYGYFSVPSDFVSDLVVSGVLITNSGASGNISCSTYAYYAQDGEYYELHTHEPSNLNVYTAAPSKVKIASPTTLTNAVIGDHVKVRFNRNAPDGLAGVIYIRGFLVSYTADS